MKQLIAFSLSMVALSAGAGVGLSVLHDHSMSLQTASLSSPEVVKDTATGFVIPENVPTVSLVSYSAPAAPVVEDRIDIAPQHVVAPVIVPAAPTDDARPVTRPGADVADTNVAPLPEADAVMTQVKRAFAPSVQTFNSAAPLSTTRSSFIDQGLGVSERMTENARPKYVVGVYR
ncbi:MAG: hypothetical protein AB3N22_01830 [Ruegeria sp.]